MARLILCLCLVVGCSVRAFAQQASAAPTPPSSPWSLDFSAAGYLLPDEPDFIQPTLRLDWKRLHFETRYAYEDRHSTSFFAGATFAFGKETTLTLTPMLGGVAGDLDGLIPALEVDFTVWRLEAYGEAEYVFDLNDSSSKFFYMWSEISLWATDWLRAGVVTQRTRTYKTERDIQRGALVGVELSRLNGTAYWFNPGARDQFAVLSFGVSW